MHTTVPPANSTLSGPRADRSTKGLRLLVWFLFSIVFALLPIGINWIVGRTDETHQDFVTLTKGGELFLIATAIGADAIGRVFLGGSKWRSFRICCGFGCFLLTVATSLYFGNLAYAQEKKQSDLTKALEAGDFSAAAVQLHAESPASRLHAETRVSHDSAWLFAFTVVAAFGVILVEEA